MIMKDKSNKKSRLSSTPRRRLGYHLLIFGIIVATVSQFWILVFEDRSSNNFTESPPAQEVTPTPSGLLSLQLQQEQIQQHNKLRPRRKWAYVFLLAGVNLDQPSRYLGYVYNTLVAAHILQTSGSQADIIFMIEMAAAKDGRAPKTLLDEEVRLLSALNVQIRYLPAFSKQQSFYTTEMQKFRVLELIEYSRVLYLDADVLPFCNLDYIFELSEPIITNAEKDEPLLKENIVIAWNSNCANGGYFMLQPGRGEWEQLEKIIEKHQAKVLELEKIGIWPPFDPVEGWGQSMQEPNDYWVDYSGRKHYNWTWYGAFGGQGLLYYWTKYIKQSVSLITRDQVENWSKLVNGSYPVRVERRLTNNPLRTYSCLPTHMSNTKGTYANKDLTLYDQRRSVPYRDFHHFTGETKPWETPIGRVVRHASKENITTSFEYWYYELGVLKDKLNMDYLNLSDLGMGAPPLSRFVSPRQMINAARASKINAEGHG
jgi:hypothetical protein